MNRRALMLGFFCVCGLVACMTGNEEPAGDTGSGSSVSDTGSGSDATAPFHNICRCTCWADSDPASQLYVDNACRDPNWDITGACPTPNGYNGMSCTGRSIAYRCIAGTWAGEFADCQTLLVPAP